MREFWSRFALRLADAEKNMRDVKTEEIETDEICEKCGKKMVIKWGKFGRFIACSGYRNAKHPRDSKNGAENGIEAPAVEEISCEKCGLPMVLKRGASGSSRMLRISRVPQHQENNKRADSVEVKKDVPLDEKCPVCANNLAIKHGRFGEYTACSDYPNCKYIKLKRPRELPQCLRRRNRGKEIEARKTFYGCSNYPDCEFVLWNKPIAEPCSRCSASFTLVKTTKRTGTIRFCNDKKCGFKEAMSLEE